ncbi:hypothetical protein, partial [Erwinia amylovora]|uniref:hypothetical protein n=1 Tax=Erwinia amylovora TaxID=552 RepID=UPI00196B1116
LLPLSSFAIPFPASQLAQLPPLAAFALPPPASQTPAFLLLAPSSLSPPYSRLSLLPPLLFLPSFKP